MERDSKSKPYNKSHGFFLANCPGPCASDGVDLVVCFLCGTQPNRHATSRHGLHEGVILPEDFCSSQVSPLGISSVGVDTDFLPASPLTQVGIVERIIIAANQNHAFSPATHI